jgi:WXG100 family type VII secretion target
MANVNVTYEQMKSQATNLKNARIEIEGTLSKLIGEIQALISEGFVTDSASGQFGTSYDEFSKGVSKTIEGLDGMAGYLDSAADTFQNVDTELAKALAK